MGPGGGFKPPPSHARVALVPLMVFHSYCCIPTGTERTETSANTAASCFSASTVLRSCFLVSGGCFWSEGSYTEPDSPKSRLNICFTQISRKETSTDQMEMLVHWGRYRPSLFSHQLTLLILPVLCSRTAEWRESFLGIQGSVFE